MLKRYYIILFIAAIFIILIGLGAFWFFYQPNKNLEVDFLDVGQGDAALIKTPEGQNILIDGGQDKSVIKRLAKVMPFYDKQIDIMILTHGHDDHVTGLVDVLKRYRVKQILYTGAAHTGPNYLKWLELVNEKKIKMTIIDRQQTVTLGQNCDLEIIFPLTSFLEKGVENLNNTSIAVKLIYGQNKFLFMGDLEEIAEQDLLSSGLDLQADVIKVGHHGSDTSSGQEFINLVEPKYAVISVGADNDFGHPSLRVINRWLRAGAEILRTDKLGTIKMASDGNSVKINK